MVVTPWGDSGTLRSRKLRPGIGTPRDEVVRNQRERLFGAMVASVAERGFEATRVADLVEISGVSSRSFYDHFPDKRACYLAAIEALIGATVTVAAATVDEELSWEDQTRRGFQAFAGLIAAQPAAARMFLVDAFAAGSQVTEVLRRAEESFEKLTHEALGRSPERAEMPAEMIAAHIGSVQEIARNRLRHGTESELPAALDELWQLMNTYRPPPKPLRVIRRRPAPRPEGLDTRDNARRALQAFVELVAEQGYANTTIDQVVRKASMSTSTFYSHFEGKEDAMLAVVDSAGAQMVAAVLPASRRASDWAGGIGASFEALFNYLSARPALARLMAVEVYVAGPNALEYRDRAVMPLRALVEEAQRGVPHVPAITAEAIAGAVYTLAYRQIRDSGPGSLPALTPVCIYLTLAPFIGSEQACFVANGGER